MANSKIVFYGQTLMDLTADTVTASTMLSGATAHDKSGNAITGTCTYDSDTSDATVAVAEMLSGKTAYARGSKLEGTMPNVGKQSGSISTKAGTVTIEQGYHDGSARIGISSTEQSKIIANNIKNGVTILGVQGTYAGDSQEVPQSKTVTSSNVKQTITPDAGYTCLSQVVINAIPYVESANSAGGTTVTIG